MQQQHPKHVCVVEFCSILLVVSEVCHARNIRIWFATQYGWVVASACKTKYCLCCDEVAVMPRPELWLATMSANVNRACSDSRQVLILLLTVDCERRCCLMSQPATMLCMLRFHASAAIECMSRRQRSQIACQGNHVLELASCCSAG